MSVFKVDVVGTSHETYMIDADSADDARARFEACEAPEPCASEVTDVEITAVEKVET